MPRSKSGEKQGGDKTFRVFRVFRVLSLARFSPESFGGTKIPNTTQKGKEEKEMKRQWIENVTAIGVILTLTTAHIKWEVP